MGGATAITGFTYYDEDDAQQTLDPSKYSLDMGRNAVTCMDSDNSYAWPVSYPSPNSRDVVTITFTAGPSTTGCVPKLAKQAILLEVGRYYFDPAQENGVNTNDGRSYEMIVKKLLSPFYA